MFTAFNFLAPAPGVGRHITTPTMASPTTPNLVGYSVPTPLRRNKPNWKPRSRIEARLGHPVMAPGFGAQASTYSIGLGPEGKGGALVRDLKWNNAEKAFNPIGRRAGAEARLARMKYNKAWYNPKNLKHNAGMVLKFLPIDIALGAIDIGTSGVRESFRWAAESGDEAGYVGGFYYGASTALARNVFVTAAASIGSFFGPIGIGVGFAAGFLGDRIVGGLVDEYAWNKSRWLSSMARSGIAKQKVNFGGTFRDSQEAYTMRQLAVQEMSGSLLNARQYLGNEAYFMHQ